MCDAGFDFLKDLDDSSLFGIWLLLNQVQNLLSGRPECWATRLWIAWRAIVGADGSSQCIMVTSGRSGTLPGSVLDCFKKSGRGSRFAKVENVPTLKRVGHRTT